MTDSSVDYRLIDSTLRDGSHAISHQYDEDDVIAIVRGLSAAGVQVIEIAHGDCLGGSSFNYGFSKVDEKELIARACQEAGDSTIACLLLPGVGLADDLKDVKELGVGMARIATHCTEADISEQHIQMAKKLDMEAIGFLMMAHMISAEELLEQALLMESYGANCLYCTDSAGYMLPQDVTDRITLLRRSLKPETEIGFHGHHNLAMGVANSLAAIDAGADRIDGSAAGLGAGAGNTPLEAMAAVLERMGADTGIDIFKLADAAEDHVLPIMDEPVRLSRDALVLGYAGAYSSFLLFAKRAQAKYGVPSHEILLEMARRRTVGGQEDLIEEIAIEMATKRG